MDWMAALLIKARTGHAATHWEEAPQGTSRPYATLFDVSQSRPQLLKGYDIEAARVQVDSWSDTRKGAYDTMEAVIAALVPGGTANGHTFQRADIVLGPRSVRGERDGTKTIFRRTADLLIYHT